MIDNDLLNCVSLSKEKPKPLYKNFSGLSIIYKVMSTEFHRIKQLPPYVFESVNKLKASYRADGDDIIDLGMGNPDMVTPNHIREKLIETVNKPKTNTTIINGGAYIGVGINPKGSQQILELFSENQSVIIIPPP